MKNSDVDNIAICVLLICILGVITLFGILDIKNRRADPELVKYEYAIKYAPDKIFEKVHHFTLHKEM